MCLVKAQYGYDNEKKKEANEEVGDDRDYAKIFAEQTSQALAAATENTDGPKQIYLTPSDFEDYFKPAHS